MELNESELLSNDEKMVGIFGGGGICGFFGVVCSISEMPSPIYQYLSYTFLLRNMIGHEGSKY